MSEDIKTRLRFHWKEGFLRKLRYQEFDDALGRDFLSVLSAVPRLSEADFDKEYMYILWMIPLYMEWQRQKFLDSSIDFNNQLFADIRQVFFEKFDNPNGPDV